MANPQVTIPQDKIIDFCRRWQVAELALFGSALRKDFGPDSDVDVLVAFRTDARRSLFDLVRMEEELEAVFSRRVDLLERVAVEQSENYICRKSILSNLEVIYAAR